MSLVNEKSSLAIVPELDIFSNSLVQTSIKERFCEEVRPLSQLNNGGHIEFEIKSNIDEYISLFDSTLYFSFRVKLAKTNNTEIVENDWNNVSLVNNFFNSLWSQIDVSINDSQTSSSLQTYAYKSYIENMKGENVNIPVKQRIELIKNETSEPPHTGKYVELEGKLFISMFLQTKLLVGGTKLNIRMIPNRPEFYFMTNDSTLIPRIHFEDIHFNIIKCRVSEDIVAAHTKSFNIHKDVAAKYILNRREVRTVTIDAGARSRNIENVINGQLPHRVYVAFVTNEAYSGSYTKNPFNFYHFDINSISCFINGNQIARKPFTPDFGKNKYCREYLELFKVTQQYDEKGKMDITSEDYKNGFTIFGFNTNQDHTHGYQDTGYVNVPQYGIMRFEIHFEKPLPTIVNALFYYEFENLISMYKDKSIAMDYR
ncbi:uncharacterized protein F54H12.2-like [Oppia nitens]|uniref:uncharacterized protein F54H12.2-like n=1 Tax=Oppia nitens TaxID=1686743 RepID=UPI0023D9A417|nr:uncharacterized protein F54H12.2-like [Oppia nitens]